VGDYPLHQIYTYLFQKGSSSRVLFLTIQKVLPRSIHRRASETWHKDDTGTHWASSR